MDNLAEEINNTQNKQESQTMEYDIQFICFHVKLLKLKGNASLEYTEKNICMIAWNLLPEKGF